MSFCATLQKKFAAHFPKWRWEVVENANPSTSVIIMAQGMMIPGELILSIQDDAGRRLGQEVVGGQSYCDFLKAGKTDGDFALEVGGAFLAKLGLV